MVSKAYRVYVKIIPLEDDDYTVDHTATVYLMNHPQEGWELFLKAYPDLNDELNKRAWRDTLRRFALRPRALDEARYDRFAKFLVERGLMKKAGPASDYATVIGAQ